MNLDSRTKIEQWLWICIKFSTIISLKSYATKFVTVFLYQHFVFINSIQFMSQDYSAKLINSQQM